MHLTTEYAKTERPFASDFSSAWDVAALEGVEHASDVRLVDGDGDGVDAVDDFRIARPCPRERSGQ